MKVNATKIPGVFVLEPKVYGDHRGFFMEPYNRQIFASLGFRHEWVQDNHSRSTQRVLRGLHYQLGRPQAKLVRAIVGKVFDVVVDIRRGSPTFGQWVGAELSAENHNMLLAPRGLAHGFVVLSEVAEFLYKVDDYYTPEEERSILWSDPDIAVKWPVAQGFEPILAAKDERCPLLADMPPGELPTYQPEEMSE